MWSVKSAVADCVLGGRTPERACHRGREWLRGAMIPLPRMRPVRQDVPRTPPLAIRDIVAQEIAKLTPRLKPEARIAVAVGSRGITAIAEIVAAAVEALRAAGARPFIIPAMGSHGGATPEGQRAVLASYGITEPAMGAPIHASLEVREIGRSADGAPAWCSTEALAADGILLVNRVKPHTDFFSDTLGSGLLKMSVIGLGKRTGAAAMHRLASRLGYERALRGLAAVILREAPVLGGLAILEDHHHATARIVALPRDEIETREPDLLAEARGLMPVLPFDEIDLLIIDRIGKDISGAGMDPNVINRPVQGYSSGLLREGRSAPFIRRIFVRDLTPETGGNANGIGLADFTTGRVARRVDPVVTGINALTALTPQAAKLPIWFESDREAIERALQSLALAEDESPRVVRIADTLSVAAMDVSAALWPEVESKPRLAFAGTAAELGFDADGNLPG